MVFAQPEIPPMIEQALMEIKNRDGIVTRKEFKAILYKLRITTKDISYYRRYLEKINYIITDKKKIRLNTIENPVIKGIILTCPECGYEWDYKGTKNRAVCPACKYWRKNVWVKISSPNLILSSPI